MFSCRRLLLLAFVSLSSIAFVSLALSPPREPLLFFFCRLGSFRVERKKGLVASCVCVCVRKGEQCRAEKVILKGLLTSSPPTVVIGARRS